MNAKSLPVAALVVLVACAAPPPAPPMDLQTQFSPKDHQAYQQTGTGIVKGQGFLRQQGGGVVTCAGAPVQLVPATPFFRELMHQLRIGRRPGPDQSLDSYRTYFRRSTCDAQGNFSFDSLPAGSWFVMTDVRWTIANQGQGGVLVREVATQDGQTSQAFLTDGDFFGR